MFSNDLENIKRSLAKALDERKKELALEQKDNNSNDYKKLTKIIEYIPLGTLIKDISSFFGKERETKKEKHTKIAEVKSTIDDKKTTKTTPLKFITSTKEHLEKQLLADKSFEGRTAETITAIITFLSELEKQIDGKLSDDNLITNLKETILEKFIELKDKEEKKQKNKLATLLKNKKYNKLSKIFSLFDTGKLDAKVTLLNKTNHKLTNAEKEQAKNFYQAFDDFAKDIKELLKQDWRVSNTAKYFAYMHTLKILTDHVILINRQNLEMKKKEEPDLKNKKTAFQEK